MSEQKQVYRIAVTNRHLCKGNFLTQIRALAEGAEYQAILLREKDLEEGEYRALARKVLAICRENGKKCILHNYHRTAVELGHPSIHLPLPVLGGLTEQEKSYFIEIGTSVHSPEQAEEAVRLGASYMSAGHIFPTDCKKGQPPRGLDFLEGICSMVSVPVYGIGGISRENEGLVVGRGAAGVCVMSGCMEGDS